MGPRTRRLMERIRHLRVDGVRKTYAIALASIACLVIATQVVVQVALSEKLSEAELINVSGRQRMLSQRIAKGAGKLVLRPSERVREELDAAVEEFASAHRFLREHEDVSAATRALLSELGADHSGLLREARALLGDARRDGGGASGSAATGDEALARLDRITVFERAFIARMEVVVGQIQSEADASIARLRGLELGLGLLTLVVLLLEAFLIFEPMRRTLRRQFGELRVARSQALAGERAKAEFLATMSHEIRTPLHGMITASEQLLDTQLSTSQAKLARGAHRSAEHVLHLLNDVLDYTKLASGAIEIQRAPFALEDLVEDLLTLTRPLVEGRAVTLEHDVDPRIPPILLADRTRVLQVVGNLLTNAAKFTESGSVRLSVEPRRRDGEVHLVFTIRDTGIGIPDSKLDQIFERFRQLDGTTTRRFGGVGLGLAITRELVEAMDGTIHVDSIVGSGTTFAVELPMPEAGKRARVAPGPRDADGLAHSGARFDGLTVLVAEDSQTNGELLVRQLHRMGCAPHWVRDGAAALAASAARDFDLILMDVEMPGMDGLRATEELRRSERHGHTPIVAVTAKSLPGDRESCFAAGMSDYLHKPYGRSELERLLERWAPFRRRPAADSRLEPKNSPNEVSGPE